MDSAESPLDVLSRAATMVQNNILPPSYGCTGGGKWRRNRTRRPPPQYSSSVSQLNSALSSSSSMTLNGAQDSADNASTPSGSNSSTSPQSPDSPLVHTTTTSNGEPIDLSTRRIRGLPPPSYSETMQCKQVYLQARQNSNKDSLVSSSTDVGALCDPMIDEHFRRSLLGQGYHSDEEETQLSTSTPVPVAATALSVDDHFAKSLGENWLEFLREEEEAKERQNGGSNNNGFNTQQRLSSDVPV